MRCSFCGSIYLEKRGDYFVCVRCGQVNITFMKEFLWLCFMMMFAILAMFLICV